MATSQQSMLSAGSSGCWVWVTTCPLCNQLQPTIPIHMHNSRLISPHENLCFPIQNVPRSIPAAVSCRKGTRQCLFFESIRLSLDGQSLLLSAVHPHMHISLTDYGLLPLHLHTALASRLFDFNSTTQQQPKQQQPPGLIRRPTCAPQLCKRANACGV